MKRKSLIRDFLNYSYVIESFYSLPVHRQIAPTRIRVINPLRLFDSG